MSIPKELIKATVPIDAYLGSVGITVGKDGMINCPFHKEKTPSCKVYTETQSFHCFACGTSGDIFDLMGQLETPSMNLNQKINYLNEKFALGFDDRRTSNRNSVNKSVKAFKQKKDAYEQALQQLEAQYEEINRQIEILELEHRRMEKMISYLLPDKVMQEMLQQAHAGNVNKYRQIEDKLDKAGGYIKNKCDIEMDIEKEYQKVMDLDIKYFDLKELMKEKEAEKIQEIREKALKRRKG